MSDVEELKNELESAVKEEDAEKLKNLYTKYATEKSVGLLNHLQVKVTKKMNDRRDRVIQLLNTVESPLHDDNCCWKLWNRFNR